MTWFRALCFLTAVALAGCARPSPEEYFAKAQQVERSAAQAADSLRSPLEVRRAFEPALELFESVVREYPHHELAEAALFEIASIRSSNLHTPQEAIDAYNRYCREYPAGKQAPLAMFMIGYLYNNELHNNDSAAAAYRRFLERFPQSEMATSAQFELNTLGKSPEEALPIPVEPQAKKGKKHAPKEPA